MERFSNFNNTDELKLLIDTLVNNVVRERNKLFTQVLKNLKSAIEEILVMYKNISAEELSSILEITIDSLIKVINETDPEILKRILKE